MIVLALHTAGEFGSVALARVSPAGGATPLASCSMEPRTLAAQTMLAVESTLQQAQLTLANVDMLAVASGPGSFTGIRIGMATAKGLAQGAELVRGKPLPLVMVSTLALLAMRMPSARAVLNAGRGDFYAADYRDHGQRMRWQRLLTREELLAVPLTEPLSGLPAEAAAPPEPAAEYITCEEATADQLCQAGLTVLLTHQPDAHSLAQYIAACAASCTLAQLLRDHRHWQSADGNYLRRTDAEVNLGASHRPLQANRAGQPA